MRIAARALLCANAFRVHADMSGGLFEELRQLCAAAAEKRWLAIGMVGLLGEHMMHGKVREASRLASEHMALIESIGDERRALAQRDRLAEAHLDESLREGRQLRAEGCSRRGRSRRDRVSGSRRAQ
jgi:hypothetical protein